MNALQVGGITPLTTIDYPDGYLSAVIYCQGCPWRCSYCHNAHLIPVKLRSANRWEEVLNFLEGRKGLLDAVVLSGGEPTLQKALPSAIKKIKQLGFKIGLHTAGCYPERLATVLPYVDWIGLDIKHLPDQYPEITRTPHSGERAWRSLDLILASGTLLEVRTTLAPGCFSDDQLSHLTAELVKRGVEHFALQTCRTLHTLEPEFGKTPRHTPTRGAIQQLETRFKQFSAR